MKDAQENQLLGKCQLRPQWNTHVSKWLKYKMWVSSVEKEVEKLILYYTSGVSEKLCIYTW